MVTWRQFAGFFLLLTFSILISSCEMPIDLTGTNIWLDVPVDGISVPVGQALQIEGHASSPEGISKIEIWINGELYFEVENPSTKGTLSNFSQEWTPPGPGEYTIQVLALGGDGSASEPDHARIQVGTPVADDQAPPPDEEEPAPEEDAPSTATYTPTSTQTATATPTSPPDVVVDFWADPGEINAGGKFTVHWHVENVQTVIFGGAEQAFDGSYADALCKNERYTLTVIHNDGTEEKRSVDIRVTGSCATATFTPSATFTPTNTPVPVDNTAPPAPNQLKPINGIDLGCVSSVMLRWEAVSDASGIAQYQVEVQRHPGDNNWSNVSGSPFTGIGGTEKEMSVECGWEYRWRVRAIDGAGNTGSWSGWYTFTIPLT